MTSLLQWLGNSGNQTFVIIFLIFFGSAIIGLIKWPLKAYFSHRERMIELENEQLQLRLELVRATQAPVKDSYEIPDYSKGLPEQEVHPKHTGYQRIFDS